MFSRPAKSFTSSKNYRSICIILLNIFHFQTHGLSYRVVFLENYVEERP